MGFFFQLETYNLVEKEIDHFFPISSLSLIIKKDFLI